MKVLRLAVAAIALTAAFNGMADDAQAKGWRVRVELQHQFTGEFKYVTLYSSDYYADALDEFEYLEYLMKVYPSKFRSDILNPLGIEWYWKPNTQSMSLIFLQGIWPTGRIYLLP